MSVTFIKSLRKSQDQCLRPLSYDEIQESQMNKKFHRKFKSPYCDVG